MAKVKVKKETKQPVKKEALKTPSYGASKGRLAAEYNSRLRSARLNEKLSKRSLFEKVKDEITGKYR